MPVTIFNGSGRISSGNFSIGWLPNAPPASSLPVTDGLIAFYDAGNVSSYGGSGTSWTDISGNGYSAAALTNGPTYSSNNGGTIVLDGTNDYILISGSAAIYTSNFTWQTFCLQGVGGAGLNTMWSSENTAASQKNFFNSYNTVTAPNTFGRIDNQTTVFDSSAAGTVFNGFNTTAGPLSGSWKLHTLVKNGSTFSLYWNNATLLWQVTIATFNYPFPNLSMSFGARTYDAGAAAPMSIGNLILYNRALSTIEIQDNYNTFKSRYGLL